MSSTMDRFDQLTAKSPLKTNLAQKTYETINSILISCEEIIPFYQDSLFYLHLYNSLYIELLNLDNANSNSISSLTNVVENLHITFDNTTEHTGGSSSVVKMGKLTPPTSPDTKYIFTFYLKHFKHYYHNDYAYAYINDEMSTGTSGNKKFNFLIKLPQDSVDSIGGTDAEAEITVNMQTGALMNYGSDVYIKVLKEGSKFYKTESSGINGNLVIKNTDMPIPLVKLGSYGIFKDFFPNGITDLEFTIKDGAIKGIRPLIKGSSTTVTSVTITGDTLVDKYKPKIDKIVLLKYDSSNENDATKTFLIETGISGLIDDSSTKTISTVKYFTKTSGDYKLNENIEESSLNINSRRKRFRKVISQILNTPVQNILSYLLYQKMYYNCIVCNTSIQLLLRREYLNKDTFGANSKKLSEFENTDGDKALLEGFAGPIISHIDIMTANINELRKIAELASKDYVIDKDYYANRINTLNDTKNDYNESLESLNNVLSNYNQYIHYYQKLKKFASAIIIFLIILIIATISITVLPMFDFNAKNTYYIIILIVLIVLTYFYYINFKHVSLYEKFYTPTPNSNAVNRNRGSITADDGTGNYIVSALDCTKKTGNIIIGQDQIGSDQQAPIIKNNNSHVNFCNKLFLSPQLQRYNITYLALNDVMNSLIYIANNKTFSNDANMYLYKLYLDKKRRGDLNKLKKTNFVNIIESIKKQITYLFNVILLISLITIILLISLIWFNIASSNINYIFAFALISITIVTFYFNSAIIQPTRMVASKNYWSNNNPSKDSLNAL